MQKSAAQMSGLVAAGLFTLEFASADGIHRINVVDHNIIITNTF